MTWKMECRLPIDSALHHEEHPELREFMTSLCMAGMSIEGVIEKGYEFELAEGMRTRLEMRLAARHVHAVSEDMGISIAQQRRYAEKSNRHEHS